MFSPLRAIGDEGDIGFSVDDADAETSSMHGSARA